WTFRGVALRVALLFHPAAVARAIPGRRRTMSTTPFALVRSFLIGLCLLSTSLAHAVEPPRIIDSYVLFAYDEMILKGASGTSPRGHIRGGDIGVNFPTANPSAFALSFATLGRVIMDPGSQAVADSVRASNPEG